MNTGFFADVLAFTRREPAGVRLLVGPDPDAWPGFGVALLIPSYGPGGAVESWKRLDWWRDTSGQTRTWPSVQEAASAAAELRAVVPALVAVVIAEGIDPAGLVLDDERRPVAVVV